MIQMLAAGEHFFEGAVSRCPDHLRFNEQIPCRATFAAPREEAVRLFIKIVSSYLLKDESEWKIILPTQAAEEIDFSSSFSQGGYTAPSYWSLH